MTTSTQHPALASGNRRAQERTRKRPVFETIWKYSLKPERLADFETAYASDGPWAKLFARFPGYRGTRLFRDLANPNSFITIDSWEDKDHYEAMRAATKNEYAKLDPHFDEWTIEETHLGVT